MKNISIFLCLFLIVIEFYLNGQSTQTYDIVVYGGTSAGVCAAVQASHMGKSVVLISPKKHLGGMTSNGLSLVDIKFPDAIGGRTKMFFNHVWSFYQNPSAWVWESPHHFLGQLNKYNPYDHLMWVLEPHVGERIFKSMIAEAKVPVVLAEQLDRQNGVQMNQQRIEKITMESGMTFYGTVFIDATYEGDLMAAAHVTYTIGRESNNQYNETLNGMFPNISHSSAQIDPYIVAKNPQSGLLPRVYPYPNEGIGEGDNLVQAYNFRMCLTNISQNCIPVAKPENYDDSQYELVFRSIEAGVKSNSFFKLDLIPNVKVDANNYGHVSTDFVGMSWSYAEADYNTRETIAEAHKQWQLGLIWTLQNHPRVPDNIKSFYASWGLPKDEFIDNGHWPYELYVREARRMISSFVMDQNVVLGDVPVNDSIGLGSYNIDSHSARYIVSKTGALAEDGGIFQSVPKPYPISYRSIIPLQQECENLVVPICLSASHVGYGSIRMEPTFMILGESAATAACIAIDLNVPLQQVPYATLRQQLLTDGQVLDP